MNKNIAILGASPKPERYSNMAQKLFVEKGYKVFPINPNYQSIDDISCVKNILEIKDKIDTLTVYMNPRLVEKIYDNIITKKPARIIFNPGTESVLLKQKFEKVGIEVIEACTLVLLKTGQFQKEKS
jgi:uncharacterized protein